MSKAHHSHLYLITPKTNLHVGAGSANYGTVDNLVQRDVSELPCINSSSFKGALREYFEEEKGLKNTDQEFVDFIFGSEKPNGKYPKGKFYFTDSYILFLIARSNNTPFFRVTSPEIIKEFLERVELFQVNLSEDTKSAFQNLSEQEVEKGKCLVFDEKYGNSIVENHELTTQVIEGQKFEGLPGELKKYPIAIVNYEEFKQLGNDLFVIPRNHLENGESQNLWYEEVVPRQSIFYTVIEHPTIPPDEEIKIENFDSQISSLVQIGGNASVGYGLCNILKISKAQEK